MRVGSCINYQTATNISSVPRPVLGSGDAEIRVVPALKELLTYGERQILLLTTMGMPWEPRGGPEPALGWGLGVGQSETSSQSRQWTMGALNKQAVSITT